MQDSCFIDAAGSEGRPSRMKMRHAMSEDGTINSASGELSVGELDAVAGGVKGKFHYVTDDTYGIGYNSKGEKLVVKVT